MVESLRRPRTIAIAALFVTLAGLVKLAWPSAVKAASIGYPGPNAALVDALLRVGLDPEALAAAGVTSQGSVSSVVSAVRSHLIASPNGITSADSTYASARVSRDQLQRKVQSGLATPEELVAYQQAAANFTSAESARQAALDAAYNAGVTNLSAGQKTALATIRANRSWNLSVEYAAGDRTQAQWVALRDALAAKKIALKHGEEVDASVTQALSNFDGELAVAAAKSNVVTYLPSVKSAWDAAVQN